MPFTKLGIMTVPEEFIVWHGKDNYKETFGEERQLFV
jgi:hypothetical protein